MVKSVVRKQKERGALVIISCHDMQTLEELSDEIVKLKEGRICGLRKRVLIICGLILLILYTARVIVVNKNADKVPVYIYDVGETVDFGNDYVDTVEECIDGYAVQVLGYEVVDTRELYERYNMGQADEATVKNTPFYCLLKVRIYNKDCDLGEEGGLMLDRYSLMGDNYMALVSENVFCTMYPDMPGTSFFT